MTDVAASASSPAPGSSVPPQEAPIGKPVSGRTWKKVEKTRFSAVKYKGTKTLSTSWEEKMLKRAKLKELKALQDEIKVRRQSERDAKRQAREEKEKRRKENELKSASVQVISRTHRMKTMSKKQLRNIKKTIVNKHGVVDVIGATAAIVSATLLSASSTDALQVFGLNYNARLGPDWAPSETRCKSDASIQQDMKTLKTVTNIVRLYSLVDCDQGTRVIPAAISAGLNVSVGLWVSGDANVFRAEKAQLESLLTRGLITSDKIFDIHVGSEAIYRNDISAAQSIAYLDEIKVLRDQYPQSKSIPVTIAEISDVYLAHSELVDAVDVVSANNFPFWEKWDVATAARHFQDCMAPLFALASSKGKRVVIGETGWASDGVSAKASTATPENALTYFRDFCALARQQSWEYFYFEAFDEEWKVAAAVDETVEAHFGLFNANGTVKANFVSVLLEESAAVPDFSLDVEGGKAEASTWTPTSPTPSTSAPPSASTSSNHNKCNS
ncbi:putative glycosyl hydrolase family 17 protein, partial [Globisporangium splendens]